MASSFLGGVRSLRKSGRHRVLDSGRGSCNTAWEIVFALLFVVYTYIVELDVAQRHIIESPGVEIHDRLHPIDTLK